jgi:glycosyltransferase involved in cell wall biosynthesis
MSASEEEDDVGEIAGSRALGSVAVCVPTYNQGQYVTAAVRSALDQDYAGEVEVWVSDDASTDDTQEVLGALAREESSLHVLRQEHNVGIAENTSRLMRMPSTQFIVRLDSDDALEPSYVRRLVELLHRHEAAGFGHTAITEVDGSGRPIRTRRVARATGYQEAEAALHGSLRGYRTAANILMFRRSVLEEMNFYEGRPEFVEDYDLSVRIAAAGYGNVYVDEPLARYRVWDDVTGMRARRKGLQLSGYRRIFEEALEPAWSRRGWDQGEVARRRRQLAATNCASCFRPQYSSEEREQLVVLLRQLGDGPGLHVRLFVCRAGGARPLDRLGRLPFWVRTLAKGALSAVRRASNGRQ